MFCLGIIIDIQSGDMKFRQTLVSGLKYKANNFILDMTFLCL